MISTKVILILFLLFSLSPPLVNCTKTTHESQQDFYRNTTLKSHKKYESYFNSLTSSFSQENHKQKRTKRNLVNLFFMISCKTNCNGFDYNGYGCYCGLLGSGEPVDGIDRCCQEHDNCYDNSRCSSVFLYAVPYFWKCYNNEAYCHYAGDNNCFRTICECDKEFVRCLDQYTCPKRRPACPSSYWKYY